jgi:hypothetical protein
MNDSPMAGVRYADLTFSRPTGNPENHFLHSILKEFKEKVVVLSYEK